MQNIDSWHFDALLVKEDERVAILYKMFDSLGYVQMLHISAHDLHLFIENVSNGYFAKNYYHNFHHVIGVCQFCYKMIKDKIITSLSDELKMVLFLACLGHDLGHPGSDIFIHMERFKAKYGSKNSLEKHHFFLYKAILERFDLFYFTEKSQEYMALIYEWICATDIKAHYSIMDALQEPLDDRMAGMLLIKLADVAYFCRGKKIYKKWAILFEKELYIARFRAMHQEQNSYALLYNRFLYKLIIPFFAKMNELFPKIKPILSNVHILG